MAINTGTRLGRYEILAPLGAGGMGEVYLAYDTQLDRKIALKLLPAEFTQDADRLRRFVQEAKAASALNHPNILTIHEIGQIDGLHFIATEYVEGQTLRQHLAGVRMTVRESLDVAIQVSSALAAAHEAGIVHRDIKPENIMLRPDGYVKVLDFGLAKLTEPQPHATDLEAVTIPQLNTDPGRVMGTVQYMSPEQARGLKLDARTDIFSLGIVLYEMITGRAAFEGETTADMLVSVLRAEPPLLAEYAQQAPAELERIVGKALRKDREQRYQTSKDLLVDLRGVREQIEFEAKLERSLTSGPSGAAVITRSRAQAAVTATGAAAVSTVEGPAVSAQSGFHPLMDEIKRHKKAWAASAILGIVVALLSFGAYRMVARSKRLASARPFQALQLSPLTSNGKATDAAISPDGKYAAHVIDDGGRQSIWMRQIATNSNVQIVPPAEAFFSGLTFSPDGNYIYYLRAEKTNAVGMLYKVPALGGTAKKVIEDVDSPVTFSPDGKRLAFVRGYPSAGESALILANADGTGEQRLATRKQPDFFYSPAWSPDGRVIACTAGGISGGPFMNIVEVELPDGKERSFTAQRWLSVGRLSWLSDGRGLLLAAADQVSRQFQVWHLAYPGGEARRITSDLNNYRSVSLSADATRMVVVESEQMSNIWVAPNADASRARQITYGAGKYGRLAWTPEGKIVYSAAAGSARDLWLMDANGKAQQLTVESGMNVHPAVTGDGRYLLCSSSRAGSFNIFNIWRLNADGSSARQLTSGSGEFFPQPSPDGKWVVYTSINSGKDTVWKVSIDGGQSVQLTDKVSAYPVVSPDGKFIACQYWDEQLNTRWSTVIIPFAGGPPIKTFDFRSSALRWSPDGRALTYADHRGGVSNIWSQPLAGGPPRQLTDFSGDRIFDFDWSRDGKQIVLSRGVVTNDIVLITDARRSGD